MLDVNRHLLFPGNTFLSFVMGTSGHYEEANRRASAMKVDCCEAENIRLIPFHVGDETQLYLDC
jgi:hypothetical protein